MNDTVFNFILIFLIALVVSFVINANVMYLVNKKLSDISIELPKAAEPIFYVETENGEVTRIRAKRDDHSKKKTESFQGNLDNTRKTHPTYLSSDGIKSTIIETDSNKPRIFLKQGYHSTPSERNMVNRDQDILNPRHDDILRYSGPGCFENNSTEKVRKAQLVDEPSVQTCKNDLRIASVNTVRKLTLTADGRVEDQHVNFYIPQTYLGASGQRVGMPTGYPGLNDIIRYSGEPADVDQIGAIPVNNYEGFPQPYNSVLLD